MHFAYPFVLLLLLLIPLFWIYIDKNEDDLKKYFDSKLFKKMVVRGVSKKTRKKFFLISLAMVILALSRPYIDNGNIEIKNRVSNLVVAFDISKSMFANDIYPNRFEFAKRKFFALLKYLKNTQVGVIAFSSRAFLVAPLTEDFSSLKYLVSHIGFDYISLKGTNIMAALEATNKLLKDSKKALLIFTDGGDKKDFSKEIEFAKENGIKVFIYAIGTKKGGVMKINNKVVRDKNGNVVIVHINPLIKSLAKQTGGFYQEYSLSSDDMKELANIIESSLNSSKIKEEVIKDRIELFKIPLVFAIIFFLMSFYSILDLRKRG